MVQEPAVLWLLRHGQSQGNVIRDAARHGDELLPIPHRDMDVPLSDLGREQATAFGRWLAATAPADGPEVVLASPYRRAAETAELVLRTSGLKARLHLDERLRERELGILDLLTAYGVEQRYPRESERRRRLGKFYYRPPGGESWVDVALRLRSLRDSLGREHDGKRVMIVAHEVVILVMRYLLEDLDEATVLGMGGGQLANCSLTTYRTTPDGRPQAELVGWTAPLEVTHTPVTEEADEHVAPR